MAKGLKKAIKFIIALIAGTEIRVCEGQVVLRSRKNGRYITISKRAYENECQSRYNAYADFDVIPVSAENAHDVDEEDNCVEPKTPKKPKAPKAPKASKSKSKEDSNNPKEDSNEPKEENA